MKPLLTMLYITIPTPKGYALINGYWKRTTANESQMKVARKMVYDTFNPDIVEFVESKAITGK